MYGYVRSEKFVEALVARWCVVAPLAPSNFDLKSHLGERRSISDVLATRGACHQATEPVSNQEEQLK